MKISEHQAAWLRSNSIELDDIRASVDALNMQTGKAPFILLVEGTVYTLLEQSKETKKNLPYHPGRSLKKDRWE